MDHIIRTIICSYSATDANKETQIKTEAIRLIAPRRQHERLALQNQSASELLENKTMMSGRLFGLLDMIKGNLILNQEQLSTLSTYRRDILDLRTTASHAVEATCQTTKQSMLTFKEVNYKRGDIDNICKKIVSHEKNMKSILLQNT